MTLSNGGRNDWLSHPVSRSNGVLTEHNRRRKIRTPPSIGDLCTTCKTPLIGPFCAKCGHDNSDYSDSRVVAYEAARLETLRLRDDKIARWVGRKLKWVGIGLAIVVVLFLITVFELWRFILLCAAFGWAIWFIHSLISDAVADGIRKGRV